MIRNDLTNLATNCWVQRMYAQRIQTFLKSTETVINIIHIPKHQSIINTTLIINNQAPTPSVPAGWQFPWYKWRVIFSGIIALTHKQTVQVSSASQKQQQQQTLDKYTFESCTSARVYPLTVVTLAPPFPALSQHVTVSKEQKPPLLHSTQHTPVATKPPNSPRGSDVLDSLTANHTCHRSRNRRPVCWHTGAVPRRCTPTLRSSLKKKKRRKGKRKSGRCILKPFFDFSLQNASAWKQYPSPHPCKELKWIIQTSSS